MALVVYGSIISTRTQRVLFLLEELNIKYETSEINMMMGEHKAPDYIEERHPFGRIPTIDDSGFKLHESRAICRYLVTKYPGALKLTSIERAEEVGIFEQAASVEYSYFETAVAELAYQKLFKKYIVLSCPIESLLMLNILGRMMGHGEPDPAAIQQNGALLCECLDLYEKTLSKSDYLTGDVSIPSSTRSVPRIDMSPAMKTFSIVDLFHAPWLQFLPRLGLGDEIESRKYVSKWWSSISNRPSWKTVLGQMEQHR